MEEILQAEDKKISPMSDEKVGDTKKVQERQKIDGREKETLKKPLSDNQEEERPSIESPHMEKQLELEERLIHDIRKLDLRQSIKAKMSNEDEIKEAMQGEKCELDSKPQYGDDFLLKNVKKITFTNDIKKFDYQKFAGSKPKGDIVEENSPETEKQKESVEEVPLNTYISSKGEVSRELTVSAIWTENNDTSQYEGQENIGKVEKVSQLHAKQSSNPKNQEEILPHKSLENIPERLEKKLNFLADDTAKTKSSSDILDSTSTEPDKETFHTGVSTSMPSAPCKGTKQRLLTGSRYSGVWHNALQCMDGYGIYTYPDGSEYRGYFQCGHFNGYGTLHLASPYNFTYKGTFVDGVLEEIDSMWFDDGLQVTASFRAMKADFSSWNYCCKRDRRFAIEHVQGIPPVGPTSFPTAKGPARELRKHQLDVEEGIYNPRTGLILHRHPPFPEMKVVACEEEIAWIRNNCRQASNEPLSIPSNVRQQIIENNLENERELREHEPSCNYDQSKEREHYFAKLCSEDGSSEDSIGLRKSSSTCESSISGGTISVDLEQRLETDRHHEHRTLGCDLEREAMPLVLEPVQKTSRRSTVVMPFERF
ncbi:uncharacterized protein LOC106093979 [Stomoxys calcitrans]|uniref:uncharacterized protein LOC106093979 n=1 Tax=Stomoxys calcitrans TaxID=35570 RepID=UPI0027E376A9|nr:uncharacterized protein LOC106093979 [Stomoxys calcitrans]